MHLMNHVYCVVAEEKDAPQPESQRCRETPPAAPATCEPSPRSIPQASSGQDISWCQDDTGN